MRTITMDFLIQMGKKRKQQVQQLIFFLMTFVCTLLLIPASAQVKVASVSPPSGGFYINGKLRADSAAGDWVQGTGTGGYVFNPDSTKASGITNAGLITDLYNNSSDLSFTGSAFADNPNAWKWSAGKPTSKDDINNVMYLSTTSNTHKWLILGGDRYTTTGTSYIDFEFLQGILTREAGGKFKYVAADDATNTFSATGGRKLGDFVLSMEYSNGGTNANVHYYIWEQLIVNGKTTYKYVDHTSDLNSDDAFAETNGSVVPSAFPNSAFGGNSYIPFAFVEAAVDIDALLTNSCQTVSINTLFVKTKASDSYTAALKDFVEPQPVSFTFGSAGLAYNTPFCQSGTATPTTPANPVGVFSYKNSSNQSSGLDGFSTSAGTFNLSNSTPGTYTITYAPSGGVCLQPSSVSITIKPLPQGSASAQSICSGGTSSVSLNSTVSGTSFTWTAAIQTTPTGGTITGFSNCSSSCGTSIAQQLSNSGTSDGAVRYTVTPTAAGCAGAQFTVDVTVKPTPSGSLSNNPAICSSSTTAVNLSSTVSGTSFTWTAAIQTTPTGGTITGFSNCSSSCGTSIAQTLSNSGTSSGIVRYVVTPTANSCAGSSFNVDVTVNPLSVGGTVASAQTICTGTSPNNLTLSGNVGSVVRWESSSNINFTSPTTINVTSTTLTAATIGNLTSDTWFRAVVQSANCNTANSNSVKITVDAASVGGTAGSAQTICSGNQPTNDLTVSGINGSVIKWQRSTDNFSSIVIDISNSANSTLLKSTIGTLTQDTWFRAVVQNGTVCPAATSSAVKITVGTVPGKPDFTIAQPSLCGPSTGTLTICQSVSGYNYTVGAVTKGGTGSALSFTSLAAGSNPTLTVVNTTGGCSSASYSCNDAVSACLQSGQTAREISITQSATINGDPEVKAYPNPFNDRVKFVVNSPNAGNGALEIYNVMGQKIKTVYQGRISAGNQSFELTIPKKQQETLIYVLRVDGKKVTGKLLQLNN